MQTGSVFLQSRDLETNVELPFPSMTLSAFSSFGLQAAEGSEVKSLGPCVLSGPVGATVAAT